MASLTFDPRSEDSANSPLELFTSPDGSVAVSAMAFPTPSLETATTGSIDTEGDTIVQRRHQNRSLSMTVEINEPTDSAAATNLITNPSFEVDTTSWATYGTNTLAAVDYVSPAGDRALLATYQNDPRLASFNLSGLTAGDWIFSVYVYIPGNGWTVTIGEDSTFSGATVAAPTGFASSTSAASAWTRIAVKVTVAGDGTGLVMLRATAGTSAGEGGYFAGASVVQASTVTSFFDGDTPGCAWTGTANASTSTRPASGGARFRATVADLEAKVAKLALEGGTLRWVNDGGESFTFDVLAADSYDKALDVTYFAGPAATAQVQLTAWPYARGSEVALALHVETTLPVLVFTESFIAGDVPALGRLVISDDSGQDQGRVIWGYECVNYDPSVSLFVQAEAMTVDLGSMTTTTRSGASGGNVRRCTLLPGVSAHWDLDRPGTTRVFARVYVPTANTAPVRIFGYWTQGLSSSSTVSSPIVIDPSMEGSFLFVELATITSAKNRHGESPVRFSVAANTDTPGQVIDIDCLIFVPGDEASGQAGNFGGVYANQTLGLYANCETEIGSDYVLITTPAGSSGLHAVPPYEGDYLRVPVQGTVRFIVKGQRAAVTPPGGPVTYDEAIDDISAQLFYTPRFLNVR